MYIHYRVLCNTVLYCGTVSLTKFDFFKLFAVHVLPKRLQGGRRRGLRQVFWEYTHCPRGAYGCHFLVGTEVSTYLYLS